MSIGYVFCIVIFRGRILESLLVIAKIWSMDREIIKGADMAKFSQNKLYAGLLLGLLLSGCTTIPTSNTQFPVTQAPTTQAATRKIETTQSILDVKTIADELALTHGANNVLVVFDIDDTLLANTADLGSTAWWNWQDGLPKTSTNKIPFSDLLAANGVMYAVSDMKPVEGQTTIDVFKHLTNGGFPVYALTARGPDNRDATLRELADQGLDFTTAPECAAPLCAKRGQLMGDAHIAPLARTRFGFKAGANTHDLGAGTIKISSNRNASVSDGVVMVAGQNKGVILRLLVDSFPQASSPKAIIFVDDSTSNVANLKATSPAFSEDLRIIHYQALTHEQTDFLTNTTRQNKALDDLKRISQTLCAVLNNQAQVCAR